MRVGEVTCPQRTTGPRAQYSIDRVGVGEGEGWCAKMKEGEGEGGGVCVS